MFCKAVLEANASVIVSHRYLPGTKSREGPCPPTMGKDMRRLRFGSRFLTPGVAVLMWLIVLPVTVASATGSAQGGDGPTYQMPAVGQCRNLTASAVTKESNGSKLVPCSAVHNDRVIAVTTLPAGSDWSTTSPSDPFITKTCATALRHVAGTTWRGLARSAYSWTWYIPTATQRAHGATWLRCDINIFTRDGLHALPHQLKLPANLTTVLQGCLTVGSDPAGYSRLTCASAHNFRAAAAFSLPSDAFPDSWAVMQFGYDHCPGADRKKIYWTSPDDAEWSFGDRVLTCYLRTTPGAGIIRLSQQVEHGIFWDHATAAQKVKAVDHFPFPVASLRPRYAVISSDSRLITVKVKFNAIHPAVVKRDGLIYRDSIWFDFSGSSEKGYAGHEPRGTIHEGQSRVIGCATGHGSLRLRASSTTLTATMAHGCFPSQYREVYQLLVEQDVNTYAASAPHSNLGTWYAYLNAPGTWPGWI